MTDFALRAPWYARERANAGLRDPAALRPAIQMYDDTDFVNRLLADPRDSLASGDDDFWSYPVPVTPGSGAKGRDRLATYRLIKTRLRKLYQPGHNRFYVVVAEVFCDQPGLPRAGSHEDIEVGFVMRRQLTSVTGPRRPALRLARDLLLELAREQKLTPAGGEPPADVRDLWWADHAWRARFEEDHRQLFDQLHVHNPTEGWVTGQPGTASWATITDAAPAANEETFPMFRLPPRDEDCDAARTRSMWFGVIPTYSGDHYVRGGAPAPKLDDRAIYEIRCFVRQKPARGHEHCPRPTFVSVRTEPFRLAPVMDPDGNSKRTTSITLPDLRRLAARAGRPMGPGGVRITTPPQSQLVFNPFKGVPDSGSGAIGDGGGICTFAMELFFIVAFFLFVMFLPIVVFAFQLWWMLALRFCIPPSVAFGAMTEFFAQGGLLNTFETDAALKLDYEAKFNGLTPIQAFDQQFGTESRKLTDPGDGWAANLEKAEDSAHAPIFASDPNFVNALLAGTDPSTALPPAPPAQETSPPDPLCPGP